MTELPPIEVRGLSKRYGDVVALDGLDLRVPSGSVFGLLGPNGAGKTTTLRLLTGLGRPTSGSASVAGVPVTDGGLALAHRIGYLGQEPRLYGWMTGRELLELVGRAHGLVGPALRARVDEILDTVGLPDAGRRRIGGYSGGMRQRLGVGQAILTRPPVLFLDEPVSALDPAGRRDILELIGSLRGSATILMSTHILNDIERVCDRVAILDRGRLVTEGAIDELLARHARPILELELEPGQDAAEARMAATLRSAPWVRDAEVDGGIVRVVISDPHIARSEALPLVVGSGIGLTRFEWVRPTLEDVFLKLVGETEAARAAGRTAGGGTTHRGRAPEVSR
jgi:ABC-2 type transport system ATP-binding protein